MKSTENKSTSSCPGLHRDMQTVCSKPAAADAARRTRNHAGNSGLSSDTGMDIHPFRHSPLCLEKDSKYVRYCCLLSWQTAGLSELTALTAVLALCWLSSPSGGTKVCPTPDTSCHLPRRSWGRSEMTWDLPGYWLFLGQHWLHCGVGADSTASRPDPCCSLQGYRRACAEPSRLCLSHGKYPQNVSACCHSITGRFAGGMGKKIGYESTTNHRPHFSAPSQEPLLFCAGQ